MPLTFVPLVLNVALTAFLLIFFARPSRRVGIWVVSTLAAYPPSAVGAKVIHGRILVVSIGYFFLSTTSVMSAAMRSAVASAAVASSVVTAGSTTSTGSVAVTSFGASRRATSAVTASMTAVGSTDRPA